MKNLSWLISNYLTRAVVPYFLVSWLLLSVVLFVQQGSHYSDIFFNANIPRNIIWQLTLALIPNVVAFTCPMAVLIGVVIGLSKMQSDNELIALRAAGIGNLQIIFPVLILGIFLSSLTLFINIDGIPFAARIVKKVALQTALYKLESPIEPGVFNTEVNGFTIYVKDGDLQKGTWKNIFIYNEDQVSKKTRLITSQEGRIDSMGDVSELVLLNALVSTISNENGQDKLVSENLRQFRFNVPTRRGEIFQKISRTDATPEELGLNELLKFAASKTGKEKTEAEIIWQRRIILSLNPLIFALLGAALVIRFTRGGQGFGIVLALVSIVIHYLLTLLGEQLARTNQISVVTAGSIPVVSSVFAVLWFFLSKRFLFNNSFNFADFRFKKNLFSISTKPGKRKSRFNLQTGLLDFDITYGLIKYFLLTFCFLTSIYLIFTAFELWKFAGDIDGGFFILIEYLFYLIPFIYIQLAPTGLMIAILAVFVVKSRQNEIITWTSAGQSIYRLLLPCFILMSAAGIFNWQFQERILPAANRKQDELRGYIRSRGKTSVKTGKFWIAEQERIFSFEMDESAANINRQVTNLSVYEFSDNHSVLERIYKTPSAVWEKDTIRFSGNAVETVWNNGKVTVNTTANLKIEQKVNPFANFQLKPNHLTAAEIKNLAERSESESMRRSYEVALQKKYATLFLPFVIALFTLPFSLSLNRQKKAAAIGYAVVVWLLFTGATSVFEQFGINDFISPNLAVWSPIFLFAILGAYLISRIKT